MDLNMNEADFFLMLFLLFIIASMKDFFVAYVTWKAKRWFSYAIRESKDYLFFVIGMTILKVVWFLDFNCYLHKVIWMAKCCLDYVSSKAKYDPYFLIRKPVIIVCWLIILNEMAKVCLVCRTLCWLYFVVLSTKLTCGFLRFPKENKQYLHLPFLDVGRSCIWAFPLLRLRFSKTVSTFSDEDNMCYESERFKTFVRYPGESQINKARLASNGFFYSGRMDKVTCFFCKKSYENWKESDNPTYVHARVSPFCPFVQGKSANVPIKEERNDKIIDDTARNNDNNADDLSTTRNSRKVSESKHNTDGLAGPHRGVNIPTQMQQIQEASRSLQNTARNIAPERNEKYGTYDERISTFSNWSNSVMKPKELALAGFYYTGIHDLVTCFYCDCSLQNFEKGNDPCVEHARFFPHCKFLRDIKGDEFIQKHQEKVVRPKNLNDKEMKRAESLINEDQTENELADLDKTTDRTSNHLGSDEGHGAGSTDIEQGTYQAGVRVLCKLCNMAKRDVLFIPCGHVVVCETCAVVLPTCLVCDKEIVETKKVYIS